MFGKLRKHFSEEERAVRKGKKIKEETRKRKVAESIYKEIAGEYEELKNKYIKLLEEKSEKFDRFTDVYELCKSQEIQIKEYKKELSDTKAEVREYERQLEEEKEKSLNYEEELTKLKKKYKIKEPKSKIEQELDEILNKKEEEK